MDLAHPHDIAPARKEFKDIDLIRWKQDLLLDKEKLEWLLQEAEKITPARDSKLNDLKELIIKQF